MYPLDAIQPLIKLINQPQTTSMLRGILEILFDFLLKDLNAYNISPLEKLIPFGRILENTDWKVRCLCLDLFRWFNSDPLFLLILKALDDKDPEVRRAAVMNLCYFRKLPEIEKALTEKLDDPNEMVLNETLDTMRKLGIFLPHAYRPRLRLHPSSRIRLNYATTLFYLAQQSPGHYIDEVFTYLSDDLENIQASAIETIAKVHDRRLIPFLGEKLASKNESVVVKCIEAVSLFQERSLIPEIILKLGDDRRLIRKQAIQCIGSFKDRTFLPRMIPLLWDNYYDVRSELYSVFQSLPDQKVIVPVLERMQTLPPSEKDEIVHIFDYFSTYDLIIPFSREFRANTSPHPYIITRLLEKFRDLNKIRLIPSMNIPQLCELLKSDELWETAAVFLISWGFHTMTHLQTFLVSIQKQQPIKSEQGKDNLVIQRIQQTIHHIEQQYRIDLEHGYSLLL